MSARLSAADKSRDVNTSDRLPGCLRSAPRACIASASTALNST